MTFDDLAVGESVFLDANVFVYHFAADPLYGSSSSKLLDRIERGELLGYTSTHILSETAHRLMTIEASVVFGWPFAGIAQRLRQHRTEIARLSLFRVAIEKLASSSIRTLAAAPAHVAGAAIVSQQTGLLSNDALIVALMRTHALTCLASADDDFDNLPAIARYAPA
jgi:predicted nucleic acid-binding protein